jgi:hypothetical protein
MSVEKILKIVKLIIVYKLKYIIFIGKICDNNKLCYKCLEGFIILDEKCIIIKAGFKPIEECKKFF